jgi:hypothetical protein
MTRPILILNIDKYKNIDWAEFDRNNEMEIVLETNQKLFEKILDSYILIR